MNKKKGCFVFAQYGLRRAFVSPKFYFIMIMIYFLCRYLYREYILELERLQESTFIFELYCAFTGSDLAGIIFLVGGLFFFADAPFCEGGLKYYLLRSTKKKWLTGQFIYIIIVAFIYNIALVVVSTLLCSPHLTLINRWSSAVGQSFSGVSRIFYGAYPLERFWLSFLLYWMLLCFVGLFMLTINLFTKSYVGFSIIVILQSLDMVQNNGYVTIPGMKFWNPLSLGRITGINLGYSPDLPASWYVIFIYLIVFILLYFLLIRRVRTYDFPEGELS